MKPVLYHLRERGFRSVIYLEDFLCFGSSSKECSKNISRFIINEHKNSLTPSRSCRFLGFIFDSEQFSVSIPLDKRKRLLQRTRAIFNKRSCNIRFFTSFIGSLSSVCPAVQYGLLHTKIFEREKFLALSVSDDNFEAGMRLLALIKEDLLWWESIFLDFSQLNFVRSGTFKLEIFTDASLSGWGAVC